MSSMKALAFRAHGDENQMELVDVPHPSFGDDDLLIKVSAFAINPADCAVRAGLVPGLVPESDLTIMGWDGSGVVESVGSSVTGFKAGDEVFFSGSVKRSGSYAEYTVVSQEGVAHKPKNVTHEEAGSMPLTTLTAWMALELFRIEIPAADAKDHPNFSKTILITAGAGGVGSIAIQLAKRVYKFGKVIATASRPEAFEWCKAQGADLVIDRTKEWKPQIDEAGITGVDYFAVCYSIGDFAPLVSVANMQAQIVSVSWVTEPVNLMLFWPKSISFAFMRILGGDKSVYLKKLASYVESGTIVPWVGKTFNKASAGTIREGHRLQSSRATIGKITYTADFS